MKQIAIISLTAVALFACTKDKHEGQYKVRYVVSGTAVDEFKATVDSISYLVAAPFAGTKDTTIYVPVSSVVKLEAKASSHNPLLGSIFVNDAQVANLTDSDVDGDSKTHVQLEYSLPIK